MKMYLPSTFRIRYVRDKMIVHAFMIELDQLDYGYPTHHLPRLSVAYSGTIITILQCDSASYISSLCSPDNCSGSFNLGCLSDPLHNLKRMSVPIQVFCKNMPNILHLVTGFFAAGSTSISLVNMVHH